MGRGNLRIRRHLRQGAILARAVSAGETASRLHVSLAPPEQLPPMPKVEFRAEARIVECEPGTALRDVCDREKAKIPFGCRNGVCGTCEIEVLEGGSNLSTPVEPETGTIQSYMIPEGHRLACQVKVLGDCSVKPI